MLIAQISDPHICAAGKKLYGKVDTNSALVEAVARVNALNPRPVAVIISGDLVNSGLPEQYAHLKSILAGLVSPYYLMPGNHDLRCNLRLAFPEHSYLHQHADYCQAHINLAGFHLLLLDSVVEYQDAGIMDEPRLIWLKQTCAVLKSEPVLAFIHHPPIAIGIPGMDGILCAGSSALEHVLVNLPGLLALCCGHTHRTACSHFAGRPLLFCPATAHQMALDFLAEFDDLAFTQEPGGFLLHRWDGIRLVSHVVPITSAPLYRYADL